MTAALGLLGAVLFVVGVMIGARSSRRLLVLEIREGRIVRAKGRAPAELLHDLEDVTLRALARGRIEILIEGDAAVSYTVPPMGEAVEQRIRNVVGRFTLPRLRGAPRVETRRRSA